MQAEYHPALPRNGPVVCCTGHAGMGIRSREQWIVGTDGSLWIERATEDADVLIHGKVFMLSAGRIHRTEAG